MTDFASLAIKIDSTEAAKGAADLDKLAASGAKAENATNAAGLEWVKASSAAGRMRIEAIGAASALEKQAANSNTATGAGRMLSQQMSQVAQQVAAGGNALQALAIQLPDIAMGMNAAGTAAGGFARFMGGPWGIALTSAISVAVAFSSKMFDAGEEAKTAGDKFETAAGQARALAGAMNMLALAKRQQDLNAKRDQALALETELDRGPTAWDRFVSGPIAYKRKRAEQESRLSGLRLDIAGEENIIRLAEQQTAAMEKETVSTKKSGGAHRERAGAISEAQRAYEQAVKSTDRYIESLALEIEKIGKTPAQLRQMEVARAMEAAATDAQRQKIEQLNVAREHSLGIEKLAKDYQAGLDWDKNVLAPLEREVQLVGLSGAAREAATLALEKEAFMADLAAKGIGDLGDRWEKYYQARMGKAQAEEGERNEAERIRTVTDALRELQGLSEGFSFGSVFGDFGDGVDRMIDAINRLTEAQAAFEEVKKSGSEAEIEKAGLAYTDARTNSTLQLIGASKKFFNEQSTGYKVLTAIEKVYAAIKLANMIKAMVFDTTYTGTSVANSMTRATADQAAGASKMFSFLGPFAFPVVAAMIALLAGLGVKGGGGKSAPAMPSAEQLQEQAGTGTVLGDSSAKSNSIANSLEIVASNTNKDLEYSNSMLIALRSIDTGITRLSGNVARQITVAGGMFDTTGANLGSNSGGGFLGLFSTTTTRELWDVGMDIFSSNVADILQNGIGGQTYQIVQQIKKKSGFLGIGGSTKTTYETTLGQIDPSITEAVNGVIYSLRQGLIEGSKVIGLDGAAAIIDNFRVEIGRLSFKDMTGDEIEKQLNAVFSKVGDQMTVAILPAILELQKVGEGAFETFMRVAREYQVVDVSLKSIGLTFGAVGVQSIGARDALVQMFESLDDFVSQTDFYRQNFLTDAERMAPVISSVADEMVRLGLASVDTVAEFKGVIDGLDLTTEAGRTMYASLMAVAPAFSSIVKYQDKLAKSYDDQAASLRVYLNDLLGKGTAASLATAKAQFQGTATQALLGDLDALGALKGVSNTFLDAAKANAKSPLDYARARAEVLRTVSQAESVAVSQAEMQRKQLAVAEATAATIAGMRADLTSLQQQQVAGTNTIASNLAAVTDGNALNVTSPSDTEFSVDVAA